MQNAHALFEAYTYKNALKDFKMYKKYKRYLKRMQNAHALFEAQQKMRPPSTTNAKKRVELVVEGGVCLKKCCLVLR